MVSHKIQIFSRTDIAIASKLLYFGYSFDYKRNLPRNNQKIYKFFVILRTKSKKNRDFHKNPTDPDSFGQKSTDPDQDQDPRNPGFK